ncbi:MAG TPA: serine hydrolase [Bacillales bacterium]|nr:serine hydrolase [Bacillales bacterium]
MNNSAKFQLSTPEEQGVSAKTISHFLKNVHAEGIELHSLMVVRKGYVISEGWWDPYRRDLPHMLFSLTKSFTSMAVGIAIDEGLFSLEDTVASFFPEIEGNRNDEYREIRVKDLLTMSPGHENATMGGELRQLKGSWVERFLNTPVDHEPGSRFLYNTSATHMLSAIIHRVSGQSLIDYLQPRLFDPLGISKPSWNISPEGHTTGGGGLSLATGEIARFGQLLLQKGHWEGRQLLPESWIEEATSCQIVTGETNDDGSRQSYGFQFWLGPHGTFRADGSFGQLCIVAPEQNAVVVVTSGIQKADKLLGMIWNDLLGMMENGPLATDQEANAALDEQLKHLKLSVPELMKSSPLAAEISDRVYRMKANEDDINEVSLTIESDFCEFVLKDERGEHHITCGYNEWMEGTTTMTGNSLHAQYQPEQLRVCGKAGWRSDNEFVMTWCFVETPFIDTVVCRFEDRYIWLDRSVNTNDSVTRPTLFGIS